MERLQKVLAHAGVGSRRKCEQLIAAGRVQVNGTTVTELGVKVSQEDTIHVDGKPVSFEQKVYMIFHKPKGVITSLSDPAGRRTIIDYIKDIPQRVYPVGRLDYDTEGLLLLTNDGELANRLTHPRFHVPKTYHVTVRGVPHGTLIERLASGIELEDGMTAPATVDYHDIVSDQKQSTIQITIHEGRNRQIRRMFDAISHPVVRLRRVQFGPLYLHGLPRGKHRFLTEEELLELQRLTGTGAKDT